MYLEKMLAHPKEVSNWNFIKQPINKFIDDGNAFENPANYQMIRCYNSNNLVDNVIVGSRYQHIDYNTVYPAVHNGMVNANFKPVEFIQTGRKFRHIYVSNELLNLKNEEYYLVVSFDYNILQKLSLSAFLFRKICANGLYMPSSALSHLRVGHKRIEDKNDFFVELPNFNVITENANTLINRLVMANVEPTVEKIVTTRVTKGVSKLVEEDRGFLKVNNVDFAVQASNKDSVKMVNETYPTYSKDMFEGLAALNTLTYFASHYGKHANTGRFNRIEATGEIIKGFLN